MTLTPQMQALRAYGEGTLRRIAMQANPERDSVFAKFREVYDKASVDEQALMVAFISDGMLDAIGFCCRASWSSPPNGTHNTLNTLDKPSPKDRRA